MANLFAAKLVPARSYKRGASVFVDVVKQLLGHFIHRLEDEVDVFLAEYRKCDDPKMLATYPGLDLLRCELRSDIFPAEWEGKKVGVNFRPDVRGVWVFAVPCEAGRQDYLRKGDDGVWRRFRK